jgi:hypothetical protein
MELPQQVRPVELMNRYPRIANKLYELRRSPVKLEHYLVDLLNYSSWQFLTSGFPQPIVAELAALAVVFAAPGTMRSHKA